MLLFFCCQFICRKISQSVLQSVSESINQSISQFMVTPLISVNLSQPVCRLYISPTTTLCLICQLSFSYTYRKSKRMKYVTKHLALFCCFFLFGCILASVSVPISGCVRPSVVPYFRPLLHHTRVQIMETGLLRQNIERRGKK